MNDTNTMKLTGEALDRAIAAYVDACVLLLHQAFQRDTNTEQAFRVWIDEEFHSTKSVEVLRHDAPLNTVARYLGIPRHDIDESILKRAAKKPGKGRFGD
jgi:hypothetical protein